MVRMGNLWEVEIALIQLHEFIILKIGVLLCEEVHVIPIIRNHRGLYEILPFHDLNQCDQATEPRQIIS